MLLKVNRASKIVSQVLLRRSSTKAVTVSKLSGVTCLTLNRPEFKNAFNVHLLSELEREIDRFEEDGDSLVAVLQGERGNFSYGYDSDELKQNLVLIEETDEILRRLLRRFCKKPIVAGISGFAIGPGLDLAVWCDFRIVEDTAVLGCYARSFGYPVSKESSRQLLAAVGFNRALDWVTTGRPIKAKEAFDCGLASRIVACGTGLGQALNFAKALGNMPKESLTADRAALHAMSGRYDDSVEGELFEWADRRRDLAGKKALEGEYVTSSGDVRRKN